MSYNYIAHVRKHSDDTWATLHYLSDHLKKTAELAGKFAAKFSSEDWGKAAGFAHDAGKGRIEWQNYLRLESGYFDEEAHLEGKSGKMPHAIHGAKLVEELYGKGIGRILSYCIAGHHAGLPDWSGAEGAGQSVLGLQRKRTILKIFIEDIYGRGHFECIFPELRRMAGNSQQGGIYKSVPSTLVISAKSLTHQRYAEWLRYFTIWESYH